MSLLGLALVFLMRPLAGRIRDANKRASKQVIPMARQVSQIVEQARNIKTFGASRVFDKMYGELTAGLARTRRRSNILGSVAPVVHQTVGLLFVVGALWVSVAIGTDSAATLGAVMILLLRSLSYMQVLSTNQQMINQSLPFATRLDLELTQLADAIEERQDDDLNNVQRVEFENVSYSYLETDKPALSNVSFSLEPPGIVGLAGPSGSGKSTLAHLVLGLLRPTMGKVLINGTPIRQFNLQSWARNVALVPQDLQLIDGTVRENIAFFRDVDDAEIHFAVEAVGLGSVISTLSDGYQTQLGTTVQELSGGQRQRLGIARALVGKPTLVVLDEPTSALDAESEAWLRQALRSYSKSALVVIITHREGTLSMCDIVLTLADGYLIGWTDRSEGDEKLAPTVA